MRTIVEDILHEYRVKELLSAARCVVFNYHRDNLAADDVAMLRETLTRLLPDWTPRLEALNLDADPSHDFDDGELCAECEERGNNE